MAYSTTLPGLPGGPLETSFPLRVSLIPASRTYQRPGIKLRGEAISVNHATANNLSTASGEKTYFLGGAEGRQASVHGVVDEKEGWVLLPVDEVGWHAGDGSGPGNMSGNAWELTQRRTLVANPTLWRRARSNHAELSARVHARRNGRKAMRKWHRDYSSYRKNCPGIILDNPTWNAEYIADWNRFYDLEVAAMAGTTPPPADDVINIGDTISALVNLNMRQQASTSAPIITTLEKGDNATVNGRYVSADGYGWLPVQTSEGNGYVAMGDSNGPYLQKLAKPVPPVTTYVKAKPIPALLDTDLAKYDTATGIITDDAEQDFVFVADVVEFIRITIAAEYAVENPRQVKAPYQIGDRAIGAWLVKARDTRKWHYILAGEGDEWIRVPYENTVRISDAPLLKDRDAVA